jgi:hypothetical protein
MKATGQKALLGFGLGTLLVAGGAGTLGAAGCSSNNSTSPTADGSTPDTSTTTDAAQDTGSSASDGGGDADAAAPPPAPVVYMVHASPALPGVRFCFGIGTPPVITSFPPLPDTPVAPAPIPGLFPGTGGSFPTPAGISLSTFTSVAVAVYAVSAEAEYNNTAAGGPDGGAELTCDQLIALGDAGVSNPLPSTDYGLLGTIPAGTLKDGKAYVIALTGCPSGLAADGGVAPLCGTTYSEATGNLGFTIFPVDNTTVVDGGTMGAQFAHASTAWDYLATADNAFTGMGFFQATPPADDAGPDAGPGFTPTVVAAPITFGSISPTVLAPVSGLSFNAGNGAFAGIGTSLTNPLKALALPFSDIAQLTYGAQVPEGGAPQNGRGYVFVLVGDPSQSLTVNPLDGGAGLNLEAAHFLVFPTTSP